MKQQRPEKNASGGHRWKPRLKTLRHRESIKLSATPGGVRMVATET